MGPLIVNPRKVQNLLGGFLLHLSGTNVAGHAFCIANGGMKLTSKANKVRLQ